jgi:hypothetical protein
VFPLVAISSSCSEILSSVCSILLEWPSILFCISFHSFIWGFPYRGLLPLSYYQFLSLICLSLCYGDLSFSLVLFRASMISFIGFCVFSCSLFLLSWKFLSASCTFWLTTSSSISMKFSLITCRISSFRVFFWALLGSLI